MKKTGVATILAERTINPALIQTVAKQAKVKLAPIKVYYDSISQSGSKGFIYVKMEQNERGK